MSGLYLAQPKGTTARSDTCTKKAALCGAASYFDANI